MKTSIILSTLFAALVATSPLADVEVRGNVPDTGRVGYDDHGITTRGNVPDVTNLATDIRDHEAPESLVTRGLRSLGLLKRETDREATDRLLFNTDLSSFLGFKAAQDPTTLDWSDNGCSNSPDKPFGFNFLHSCQRHDFGYRNYKKQGRFTEANRKRIDDKFKEDLLKTVCEPEGALKQIACEVLANTYYEAVRAFGGF